MNWAWAVSAVLLLLAGEAEGHTQRSGVMRLTCSGENFTAVWSPPAGVVTPITPEFSENCTWKGRDVVCEDGPVTLSIRGTEEAEIWLIRECDGESRLERMEVEQTLTLEERPGWNNWVVLGFEHVLSGWDHVLFVLLLMLWIRPLRTLLWAISGFTLGHSLVLFLVHLWDGQVSSGWIEAVIAASIVLLLREVLGEPRKTLSRRYPVFISSFFGLVHGMGFAGALKGWGVTESWQAIVGFNAGIELGQFLVIGLGFVVLTWSKRINVTALGKFRRPVLYGGGALISVLISLRLMGW